ncbi:MAG: T9SS type A sorting domain-containing protein [bacterium]|nr:MAG: T9SS type A sorting domain-containing protein [bacterium]
MRLTLYLIVLFFTILFLSNVASGQNGLTSLEELGKAIYFDKIADPDRMACADCHHPRAGFTGPIPGVNNKGSVYRGAVPQRFGNRKPPSAAYATDSPVFYYDTDEELFIGGNFWDGRATGWSLGAPAAEQALGPFLNPVEQNNASKLAVLEQIASSKYAYLWEIVWGLPISLDPADVDTEYDRIGLAINAFEGSSEVNQYSSKYDAYLAGQAALTSQEAWGLELFEGKAQCSACHPSEAGPLGEPPLFTDFTFDNLGIPKNPLNPYYDMDEVFLDDGTPINPLGDSWIDPGLGGFLATLPASNFEQWEIDKTTAVNDNYGKHKVPTLRNVDKRPDVDFIKAYGHNGFFKSLEAIVHFYNTRDVEIWPAPEVSDNVNTEELGDLGLTAEEETAIVAFMKTLSDGYDPTADKQSVTMEMTLDASDFRLAQNYPNPFNPQTTITFDLPAPSEVTLKIYNVLGEEVATLLSNSLPSGPHSIVWVASNYTSGVYLYKLETPEFVQTRKMMLMK